MAGDRLDETTQALRALAHPLSVGSLVVLALNDHVLKQAWPGWVTGKLSDVVGLVVAPLLLAVGLGLLGLRRPVVVAVLATGLGFALVKTTGTGSDLASHLWSAVAGTSYLMRDPTDLVALPALLVALRVHRLAGQPGPVLRRRASGAVGALVLPLAVLATAATSACDDGDYDRPILVMEGRWESADGWDDGQRFVYGEQYVLQPERGSVEVRLLSEQERVRIAEPGRAGSDQALCDPARPRLCWRTYDPDGGAGGPDDTEVESLVVYASEDGGRTWTEETVLGADAVERRRADAGEVCGAPLRLSVSALAVMSTADGPLVVASMTNAGLAIRDAGGSWEWLSDQEIRDEASRNTPPSRSPAPMRDPLKPARRHPLNPGEVVTPVTESPTPSNPTPSGPPCPSPSWVSVTPDPRNGQPYLDVQCPPSPS